MPLFPLSREQRLRLIWIGLVGILLGLLAAHAASARSTGAKLVLLAALAPFVLMLVRDVRKTLLVAIVLDTAFQWDKNFGYDIAAANLGALGGINVSVTTIALAALYFMWFAEHRSLPRPARHTVTFRAALPLIVYMTFTALSIFVAGNKALSVNEVLLLVQTFLLFLYVGSTVRTREELRFLAISLMVCLLLESLVTLAGPVLGNTNIMGLKTYAASGVTGESTRFAGTLGFANTAAAFFALLIAPTFALATTPVSRRVKRLAAIAVATSTLGLVLTFSRGGWIAFVVSFCFLVVIGGKRGWISPRIPVATAIALAVIMIPFSGQIATRITGNDNGSASGRVPLIHLASAVIRDHPFLGVGANNVGIVFPKYAGPQYDQDWIYTVHDKYLLVWAEAGIGALIGFLWFLLSTLRRGWRVWRLDDPLLSPLALGITAAITGQMVHMTVDIFQNRPLVQSLWLVAGLLVAMENTALREGLSPAPREAEPA